MGDEGGFDVQGFARDIHELLVLAALRDGPKHGYQIGTDVESESNGLFRFKHGTLYPILHRLESERMIKGSWSTSEGRRRKVYRLTSRGRSRLRGGTDRVQEVVRELLTFLRPAEEVVA